MQNMHFAYYLAKYFAYSAYYFAYSAYYSTYFAYKKGYVHIFHNTLHITLHILHIMLHMQYIILHIMHVVYTVRNNLHILHTILHILYINCSILLYFFFRLGLIRAAQLAGQRWLWHIMDFSPSPQQLLALGTKVCAWLGWYFLAGNFYLENYGVSWRSDCFKRKNTHWNGNQVSPSVC
jgi:hypothetical protein